MLVSEAFVKPNMFKRKLYNFLAKSDFFKDKIYPYYYLYLRIYPPLKKIILPALKKQLVFLKEHKPKETGPRILVPLIETSHHLIYTILLLAKALQIRGAKIKLLVCDGSLTACESRNCENKNSNVCLGCKLHIKRLIPCYGMETLSLGDYISPKRIKEFEKKAEELSRDYPDKYIFHGMDIIPEVNNSIRRYYFGWKAASSEELRQIRFKWLRTALICSEVCKAIDDEFHPEKIMSIVYKYQWFPFKHYYENTKVDRLLIGFSDFSYNLLAINKHDLWTDKSRFKKFIEDRGENKTLDSNEKKKLMEFIQQRRQGESQMFLDLKIFDENNNKTQEFLKRINPRKKNIFLFTSNPWDMMIDCSNLFPNYSDMVFTTIELLKGRSDYHLYIKIHPVDIKMGRTVADSIKERYPQLPENVTLIRPEEKIKPYDLFPYIDKGIVLSGTLGIEMLLDRIPVITLGDAPYSDLGFTYEPKNLEEFKEFLFREDINRKTNVVNKDMERFYLFCYFYFIKTLIPFDLVEKVRMLINFDGYKFNSLDDLLPGKHKILDHICNCLLDPKNTSIENW